MMLGSERMCVVKGFQERMMLALSFFTVSLFFNPEAMEILKALFFPFRNHPFVKFHKKGGRFQFLGSGKKVKFPESNQSFAYVCSSTAMDFISSLNGSFSNYNVRLHN